MNQQEIWKRVMRDTYRTILLITGVITLLFMLLIGFNVWAFTTSNQPVLTHIPPDSSFQEEKPLVS